jgi:Putative Ig domain
MGVGSPATYNDGMKYLLRGALVVLLVCGFSAAQQGSLSQFAVATTSLPSAKLRQPFQFQLQTQSGIPNFKWVVTRGSLPPGLVLSDNGMISGTPTEKGEFPCVVSVTDSSTPPLTKSQAFVFHVVAPLIAEWNPAPKVNGRRIEGGIKVSNQTGHDFDLTVIVMAINENGRATAIGYQHVDMKDATDLQIPVGENLPRGAYSVDGTVVAEIVETNTIHRVHLVSAGKLQVAVGP